MKFLRVKRVAERYDTSPATVWRWSNDPRYAHLGFPKPVPLGDNTTAWIDEELDEYDQRRIAAARAAKAHVDSDPLEAA